MTSGWVLKDKYESLVARSRNGWQGLQQKESLLRGLAELKVRDGYRAVIADRVLAVTAGTGCKALWGFPSDPAGVGAAHEEAGTEGTRGELSLGGRTPAVRWHREGRAILPHFLLTDGRVGLRVGVPLRGRLG